MKKISYSLSFLQRCRCKFCKGEPVNYYFIANKRMLPISKRKVSTPIVSDDYSWSEPKDFTKISRLSYSPTHAKTSTITYRYHKNRKNMYLVAATCKCEKSMWHFIDNTQSSYNPFGPQMSQKFYDKEIKYVI